MEKEEKNSLIKAILLRVAYMVAAIVAVTLIPLKPAFSFKEDKGIIYVRSFSMDQRTFVVMQTELKTGAKEVTETMSVKGLYYCYKAMLWGSILCLLCFFSRRIRVLICDFVAITAGVYYLLMVIYAVRISDLHFATLYPNFLSVILPAIVMQMMLLTRHSVLKASIDEADDLDEKINQDED